jgi:internalin A
MSQAHLIDKLAQSIGLRIRKPTRTEFFLLVKELFDDLNIIKFEILLDHSGYNLTKDSLYEADDEGNIRALSISNVKGGLDPVIGMMNQLELILINEKISARDAAILSSLPKLKCLVCNPSDDEQYQVLLEISRMKQLESLVIVESFKPVDISILRSLPHLRSLILGSEVVNIGAAADIASLRAVYFDEINQEEIKALGQLRNVESIVLDIDEDFDLSTLKEMTQLRSLIVDGGIVPMDVVLELSNLQVLGIKYSHPTLEPLLHLRHLESLSLKEATITDFSALIELDKLRFLEIDGGGTQDISQLEGLASINSLNIKSSPITRMPSKLRMPNLRYLNLESHNKFKIEDANFISSCLSLETLDLSGHALTSLDFLRSLDKLQVVNVNNNHLTDIEALADLQNLTDVNISGNKIKRLSPLSSSLTLKSLDAQNNPIEDINSISGLYRLEKINLNLTGVRELSFVKRLRNLFEINLADNKIESAQALIELPFIGRIDLSNNLIREVPRSIIDLQWLESLNLRGNPIEGVDKELFEGPDEKKTLESLRDYYRGLARGRVKHDEVKLLMVGNGRVGKTSVVSRLLDHEFDPDQPSTHGIQLRQWQLDNVVQDKLNGRPLKINIWDFGGQDIYHATHRLFMKTRALFLLVWDSETEDAQFSLDEFNERYENFSLPYWIDYIKVLSGSPVIIVQNKVDSLRDKRQSYGQELRQTYPPPNGIADFCYVSAKKDEHNGMAGLTESIASALESIESIGSELPSQWVAVRYRLQELDHRFIDYNYFENLCFSEGLYRTEPRSLLDFLHKAGVVFYQPGSFGDRIILDQKWAIEAVYAIFDRRGAAYRDLKIAGRNGLTLDLLRSKVWRHFTDDEHRLLLEFMKSCELCFEFSKDVFYAPQLLPAEKPPRVALRWTRPTTNCMQITYNFLHRAIIERFIVRSGRLGADLEPEIWKNGIVIYDNKTNTEAMVEANPNHKSILIQAKGDADIEMLHMIRTKFDELHDDFPAQVAFSADGGQHFVNEDLIKQHSDAKSARVPSTGGEFVALAPLLIFLTPTKRHLPVGKLKKERPLRETPNMERPFMKTVKIFLASSEELRTDRDEFDLYFRQKNDEFQKERLYLQIIRWENFLDAISDTRLQDEYDKKVQECDIFVSLFKTKTGKYTEEEFNVAYKSFKDTGKPRIYTFFKEAQVTTGAEHRNDLISLWNFQEKLKSIGHFFTVYKNTEHLKLQFKDQLEKLRDEGKI